MIYKFRKNIVFDQWFKTIIFAIIGLKLLTEFKKKLKCLLNRGFQVKVEDGLK